MKIKIFLLIVSVFSFFQKAQAQKNYPVRFNEILANPSGKESENEFIEIYNSSHKKINLSNWIIKYTRYYFYKEKKRSLLKVSTIKESDKYIILPQKFLILKRKDTHCANRKEFVSQKFDKYICGRFNLYNSGEIKIELLNPQRKVISVINYKVESSFQRWLENVSFNYFSNGWQWSQYATKNKKNKKDSTLNLKFTIPKEAYLNIYTFFKLKIKPFSQKRIKKIIWDFGDGHRSYKLNTSHKYESQGKYKVKLTIFDGSHIIKKFFHLKVKKFPHYKIKIIKIVPNPSGKDKNKEYLVIYNKSKKNLNLKGWSIATGSKSNHLINHPIFKKFKVASHQSKHLTGKYSHFILANKKTTIELRYPDGGLAYKIRYKYKNGKKNIPDDAIYFKRKGSAWKWKIKKKKEKKTLLGTSKNKKNKSIVNNYQNTFFTNTSLSNQKNDREKTLNKHSLTLQKESLRAKENQKKKLIQNKIEIKTPSNYGNYNFLELNNSKILKNSIKLITQNKTNNNFIEKRNSQFYFNPQIKTINYWNEFLINLLYFLRN